MVKTMKKMICALMAVMMPVCGAMGECAGGVFRLGTNQNDIAGVAVIPIEIDAEGKVYTLRVTEDVTNVILDEMVWQYDEIISRTVWTNEEMLSNHMVALRSLQGETLPRFRVTAVNGAGERERWYITWSGEDGAPILISSQEVEGMLPVTEVGLTETENRSRELFVILTGNTSLEECEAAAAELAALWEGERVLVWGGYAMSYAEQRWEAERAWRMLVAARNQEELPWYGMLLDAAYAGLTRQHVYDLLGKTPE